MKAIHLLNRVVGWAIAPERAALRLLGLVSLVGLASLAAAQASIPNRAGLVVTYGDKVIKKCVEFSEAEINGYELLKRAGLDLNIDVNGSMGAAVCRIDGKGCTYPEEDCFCQCQGNPCRFWIYWHLDDGEWKFSGLGASNSKVRPGDVEGWVWGEGSPNTGGDRPPQLEFEEICAQPPAAAPTNTPVPPTPSPSPTNTSTPEPAATPTPIARPAIHRFVADRTTVNAGESVLLSWDLSGAAAAYLRYNGVEEGVIAPGSKMVSPASSTTYTLVARNDGGETRAEITISVAGAAPATAATSAPMPVPAPAGESAAAPTAAAAPEPVISFSTAAQTLPAGSCTTLIWQVQQASLVYLDESEVEAQGSQEACPARTQVYTLRVFYPGGERTARVTLAVNQATSTLAPLPTGVALATPVTQATIPATLATAAATPAVLAPAETPRPIRRNPERNMTAAAGREEDSRAGQTLRLLTYGGVAAALLLFLVAPVTLLAAGWVAWWLRRRS